MNDLAPRRFGRAAAWMLATGATPGTLLDGIHSQAGATGYLTAGVGLQARWLVDAPSVQLNVPTK